MCVQDLLVQYFASREHELSPGPSPEVHQFGREVPISASRLSNVNAEPAQLLSTASLPLLLASASRLCFLPLLLCLCFLASLSTRKPFTLSFDVFPVLEIARAVINPNLHSKRATGFSSSFDSRELNCLHTSAYIGTPNFRNFYFILHLKKILHPKYWKAASLG